MNVWLVLSYIFTTLLGLVLLGCAGYALTYALDNVFKTKRIPPPVKPRYDPMRVMELEIDIYGEIVSLDLKPRSERLQKGEYIFATVASNRMERNGQARKR